MQGGTFLGEKQSMQMISGMKELGTKQNELCSLSPKIETCKDLDFEDRE